MVLLFVIQTTCVPEVALFGRLAGNDKEEDEEDDEEVLTGIWQPRKMRGTDEPCSTRAVRLTVSGNST